MFSVKLLAFIEYRPETNTKRISGKALLYSRPAVLYCTTVLSMNSQEGSNGPPVTFHHNLCGIEEELKTTVGFIFGILSESKKKTLVR